MAYTHQLPPLSFDANALEPHFDAKTMEIHHGKHHAGYVANLNKALESPEAGQYADMQLEELLYNIQSLPAAIKNPVRNNAGGHFNHSFFWQILTPSQNATSPIGHSAKAIEANFESFENFKEQFKKAAMGRFGSGWVWMIINDQNQLEIVQTAYQDNPLMEGVADVTGLPVLGLDVWEHAYYLTYQNRRADYVDAFWNVIDWEKVEAYFNMALKVAMGGCSCGEGCGCKH